METNSSRMILLNGSNYHVWKAKMEDLLYVKDYYLPVFATDKPENKTDAEWEILHRQVCGYIRQWVEDNVLNHIIGESHARTLWNKLEELYARKTGNNKLFLIKKLIKLEYRDGTPVADHLNAFQGIVNQLSGMGIKFDEEIQGLWLLGTLPDSWETFRTSLSNSAKDGVITMELAKNSIMNEEMRRKSQGSSSHSDVLVTERRGRSQSRGPSNRGNQRGTSSSSKGKFADVECYYCGKKGHTQRYCRQAKKENKKANYKNQKNNQKKDDGGNDNTEVNAITDEFFVCCDFDMVNVTHDDLSWIADSGATCHVATRRDFYSSYTPGDYGVVRMGNTGLSKIVGIGEVRLKFDTGMELVLHNVKHVPDMRLNVISTGLLDDDGYYNGFGNGKWKLTLGSLIVGRGEKVSKLYVTHPKISCNNVNAVENVDMSELWHKRLGHMSKKGMSILSKKNVLSGVHDVSLSKCSHCLAGKQTRVAFKSHSPFRMEKILDLVHSDVCGPMKTRSLGGCYYFVTFIDDHSRKVWVYTLKTKDQVLDVFKQFHASVERETGKKLKCIRTDNGGEYIGPFDAYCREQGIRHQKTPPKTPQLNGLAERMNRTLVERVRCLLSHAGLPPSFWGEALNTAVHVINLTPCVPLHFDVPNRVWSGKDVSYSHLRVFGCKAFVHIPKDERSKLDVKSKPCVFLGYGYEDEFGYRLYDPVEKRLVRSRDVVFVENQTLKDVEKTKIEIVPQHSDTSADLDPVPPQHVDTQFGDDFQNDNQQGTDDIDAQEQDQLDEDVHPELPVPNMPPFVPLRRSNRDRHPSTRYSADEYVLLTDGGEPECYAEAMEDDHKKEWVEAMQDEMNSLYENNTFELVKLPKGKKVLKNKWVYKVKTEENTSRPRYKARLVVKGFSQRKGIDFDEIFSPVVKMGSIRVVLGLAASLDLEVEQMDVKTAFLHGDLDKEIYMEQPEGFQVKGKEDYVCRLQKSLYGLKQAPRQWYKKFESVMGEQGYRKTTSDHCVFFQRFGDDDFIILLLYVDDMLIVGKNTGRIAQLKRELSKSFAMKDLGPAKQILGIRITRDRGAKKLHMSQEQYIEKVLRRFNMDKAKVVSSPLTTNFKLTEADCPSSKEDVEEMDRVPYASAVGSLMYAMVCTRPDIAHAVGVVSRFMSNPGKKHWEAVKWIFRYLRGTSKLGITFGDEKPMLVCYTDSDMAGNKDNMKSTSGYLMTFAGGAVSWQSRLQKCVALSTTEAEYMAATEACKELLWLKRFLQELGFKQQRYVVLCDNQSAIHLAKNSMFHKRTKHIDVRYHWIRDCLEDGLFELDKVHTDDNGSDMLTKPLAKEKLKVCCSIAGMANSSS
jgi:transposase InsO family protein